jgi:hypothetical protein
MKLTFPLSVWVVRKESSRKMFNNFIQQIEEKTDTYFHKGALLYCQQPLISNSTLPPATDP